MTSKKKKVLLIGWDAADWKAIHPLMDAGLMPNLNKMVNNGVMGKLATLDPPLSPMLWSSISTGKRPFKHGILGFTEPKPDGSGIQPVLNTSRKCRAIWNILMNEGYKCNVVGWWPSHPAEPIDGVYVSNFYQKAPLPKDGKGLNYWPLMEGVVHPEELSDIYAKLRVHPWELTEQHLQPFIPNGAKLDQTDEKVQKFITSLRKIIADASTVHSAATYTMQNTEWDFMAIYYDAIDHFGHGFMKFHPPRREFIPEHLYEGFNNVVTAGYRYHDMILGRLMKLAGPDTNVMLISDHGFHPDHLRPRGINRDIPAAAATEHSPYGIIVAHGPDFKKDAVVHGSSLIDISPTLLALLDRPVGEDMDGRVLQGLFKRKREVEYIETWDTVEGNFGTYDAEKLKDSAIDAETLEQLIELGYIERPPDNAQEAIKRTTDESKYWEALAYVDAKLYKEAKDIMLPLAAEFPEKQRYVFLLMKIHRYLGEGKDATAILEEHRKHVDEETASLSLLEARLLVLERKYKLAIEKLTELELNTSNNLPILLQLGNTYTRIKDYNSAERSFRKALKTDPQNERAFFGLGYLKFKEGNFEDSAKNFVESIALRYDQPNAHYYLGECLLKLGNEQGAAKAFSVALEMDEGLNKARMHIERQNARALEQNEEAEIIDVPGNYQFKKDIFVVSGLPRSGTSMMMQILDHHGIPLFIDNKRGADDNNKKGYYEHEDIMKLRSSREVFNKIDDKQAVKIVAPLLNFLSPRIKYHVIFMDRDLGEILNSQSSMLERLQKAGEKNNAKRDKDKLRKSYEELLNKVETWSKNQANIELHYVKHADCFRDPELVAERLNSIFGRNDFTPDGVRQVVDPSMYREKIIEV